jgi:nanoRNase/pAp phosphatase (c-di-AMP/oligoRNAs hydrolase)
MLLASKEDFHAAGFLSQFSNHDLLQKIMAQSRPKHTMEVIHKVLGRRVIVEGFSIAGAGYIRSEDRDAIPQAADFLLTEENVHTAVVYGILRKEKHVESLVGSLRTNKLTLSPDKFLKEVLGQNESGHAYGGGKQYAGGFDIPVGFLSDGYTKEFEEMKWLVFDEQLKNRLLNHIGAERSEEG